MLGRKLAEEDLMFQVVITSTKITIPEVVLMEKLDENPEMEETMINRVMVSLENIDDVAF